MKCRYCGKADYYVTDVTEQESDDEIFKQRVYYWCPACQATDRATEFYRLETEAWDELVIDPDPTLEYMELRFPGGK
jgi:transcriptional regulator NrdR family protein